MPKYIEIHLNTSKYVAAARVEDGDEPPWTQHSGMVTVLFCALIDSTAEIYGILNPKKNAMVSRSTSGIGQKFAGTI